MMQREGGLFALLIIAVGVLIYSNADAATNPAPYDPGIDPYDPGFDPYNPIDPGLTIVNTPVYTPSIWDQIIMPTNTSGARGIRNNNPGNIRKSSIAWQGKTGNDGVFEIFDTPANGIRALARNLLTYQRVYHLNTIAQLINKWAPSNENDTGGYVAFVANQTGIPATSYVNLEDAATLASISNAIILQENGSNPYNVALVSGAVNSAIA